MKVFGLISAVISIVIILVLYILFFEYIKSTYIITMMIVFSLLVSIKVICIKNDTIKFISFYSIFLNGKKEISITDIDSVKIGDGGLTAGLSTIKFYARDSSLLTSIFLTIYPFERRKLAKYLKDRGVSNDGNGI